MRMQYWFAKSPVEPTTTTSSIRSTFLRSSYRRQVYVHTASQVPLTALTPRSFSCSESASLQSSRWVIRHLICISNFVLRLKEREVSLRIKGSDSSNSVLAKCSPTPLCARQACYRSHLLHVFSVRCKQISRQKFRCDVVLYIPFHHAVERFLSRCPSR